MAIKRNEVVFNSQPQPQPQNENKLAKFLASIGKFVETPEGQQTATNLASAIPLLFGRSDIASGIVGAGQQAYDRQMQEQKAREDQAFRNLQLALNNQTQNRGLDIQEDQIANVNQANQSQQEQKAKETEQKNILESKQEFKKTNRVKNTFDKMLQEIDRLIQVDPNNPNKFVSTDAGKTLSVSRNKGVGGALLDVPEILGEKIRRTKPFMGPLTSDAMSSFNSIVANLGFDELRDIKDSSKTGGAVGQVSDREIQLLQLAGKAIQPGMSDEEFVQRLAELRNRLIETRSMLPKSAEDIYKNFYNLENQNQFNAVPLASGARIIGVE